MAIVFACEKFDQYLNGRNQINVETDHKPLIPIFKKPLLSAPKQLQKMLLRLQKYSIMVTNCPGKQIYIADMLSRAYIKEIIDERYSYVSQLQSEIEAINHAEHVHMKESTHYQVKKASQCDQMLQVLRNMVLTGWPEHKHNTPICIHSYWNYRDEIVAQDEILYRGSRVIIPQSMRPSMLKKVHASHQGAEACIRRAKDVLFWPGMNGEITNMVSQCAACNEYQSRQQKEPMMTPEIPTRPWQMVAQDLFTVNRENYLITVDYFSDYWELDQLPDTLSSIVIEKTKQHFARYGIPETVISDNGPQFHSYEYTIFSKDWDFVHITSSPYHSQSNGKAESAVKIAKLLLKKANTDNTDIQLAILNWRNTPTESSLYSPSQKLHSRRTRKMIPTTKELLQPEVAKNVVEEIRTRRQHTKLYYDRTAKALPELVVGQGVRIQPLDSGGQWRRASVIKKVGERSYLTQTPEGQVYRRNPKHLRATNEESSLTSENATGDVVMPPGPTEPEVSENVTNLETKEHLTNPDVVLTKSAEQEESLVDGTPQGEYMTTRSGRSVKPPIRYRDYTNTL